MSALEQASPAARGEPFPERLFDAGFTDLVSVIPPGAQLAPSSKIPQNATGKIPGVRLSSGLWCGTNWRKLVATADDVRRWCHEGANVGLRADRFPAVDIDCLDPVIVERVSDLALARLGPAPIRIGRAPKALLMYRTDEPFGRMRLILRKPDGEQGLIEILGAGQQYLVHGIHPNTGLPYAWQQDPTSFALTHVSAEQAKQFLDSLAAELSLYYAVERVGDGRANDGTVAADQEGLVAPSIEVLREAVALIPNDDTTAPGRDEYIRMAYAIHAAGGIDHNEEAFEVFAAWAGKHEADGRVTGNPETWLSDWRRVRPPYKLGWNWIAELARGYGFNDAQYDFTADPNAKPSTQPPPPGDRGFTDTGNAARFVNMYRNTLCRVHGAWLRWDGKRYAPIEDEAVERLAKAVPRTMHAEAAALTAPEDDDRRKALHKWASNSESATRIAGMVKLARGELLRSASEFDADPNAITVTNGILDLRCGQVRAATPSDATRLLAGTHFDASAEAPVWERFITKTFGGDADMIGYVQRLCGYALTGLTTEQMLAFLHGDGANGKSTFLETLSSVLGEYAAHTPFSQFLSAKHAGTVGASPEIVRLRGKRAVIASESRRGAKLDETQIKSLTGGDTIAGRELYKGDFQEFRPQFKLLGAVNHKPELSADDPAVWRRMHLIPFAVTIPIEDRDPELPVKLRAELPGILAWMVRGCTEWQRTGLKPPTAVIEATASYRAENDDVARFIHERCEIGAARESPACELYAAYSEWVKAQGDDEALAGVRTLTQKAFGTRVKQHDPGRIGVRKSGGTIYTGIGLKSVA